MPQQLQQNQMNAYGYMPQNLLVNPGFEIWQRGAGPFAVTLDYTADEWRSSFSSGTMSVSQESSIVHGGVSSLKIVDNTSGTGGINQGVEIYSSLEGLWLTFSVDVYSSLATTVAYVGDWTSAQELELSDYHTGSGGWERLTVTKLIRSGLGTPPSSWPHLFSIRVGVAAGSAGTIYLDNASLVIGNFPDGVPFIPLNPAEDQARCERFFEETNVYLAGYSSGAGSNNWASQSPYHTRKYATPTLTGNLVASLNCTKGSTIALSEDIARQAFNTSGVGNWYGAVDIAAEVT